MNTLYKNMIRFRTKNLHEDSKDGKWKWYNTAGWILRNTGKVVDLFKGPEIYPDQKYEDLKKQGYKLSSVPVGYVAKNPTAKEKLKNITPLSTDKNNPAIITSKYYMYKGDQTTTKDIVPIPQMYYSNKSATNPYTPADYDNYIDIVKGKAQKLVQANDGVEETEFALKNILKDVESVKDAIRGVLPNKPAPLNKQVVTTIANTVASSPKVANEFVNQIVQLAKDVGVKVT